MFSQWSNFKKHVLAQPEPVRLRYVKICVGVTMALVLALWIAWALVKAELRGASQQPESTAVENPQSEQLPAETAPPAEVPIENPPTESPAAPDETPGELPTEPSL